ncbi:MAG: DUF1801 domain-containing protein [Saprospiraceae bacterium]|nr:DUF1801 domain-containing protein [Saprospiraceae bacterium]HNL40507.1 DUF1801 domain-containing protein [Saprospiraceae bacterium]
MQSNPVQNVEEYIARQTPEHQAALRDIRALIHTLVPGVEEQISYQIPCFKLAGVFLVGIGTTRKYCSFYPMSSKLAGRLKEEWPDVKMSGTTFHFELDRPLPRERIEYIVRERIAENIARAALKKKPR